VTTAPRKTGLILLLLCAAQFMVVLDIAIVNVALPSIQTNLAMSQAGLDGFHAAFLALAVIAALGAVNSSVRFPRHHLERIDA
jgi:MFS family permease